MRVRFTRLDDRRHVLSVERGGAWESVELETRSTLHHDLTHLAVEEAAGIAHGFFGSLAAGKSFAELAAGMPDDRACGKPDRPQYSGAMLEVERAVAVLQGLAKADEDPAALHARIVALQAIQDSVPPAWFTVELVTAVRARLRQLVGHWRATPPGGAMEVEWVAPARRGAPRSPGN